MFPDFSGLGEGMKSLNEKFDRIIALLEKIESNTHQPTYAEICGSPEIKERHHG